MSVGGCIAKQLAISAGLHLTISNGTKWIAGIFTGAGEAAAPPPNESKPASGVSHHIKHASFWAALAGAIAGAIVAAVVTAAALIVVAAMAGLTVATLGAGTVLVVGVVACLAASDEIDGAIAATTEWVTSLAPVATDGPISVGSPDVLVGGLAAARATLDPVLCVKHNSPQLIAEGSISVYINGFPATRVDDKVVCGAPLAQGVEDVLFGGPKGTFIQPKDEFSWWEKALIVGVTFLIPPSACMRQGLRNLPRALFRGGKNLATGVKNMVMGGINKGASLARQAGAAIKNKASNIIKSIKTGSCTSSSKNSNKNTSNGKGKNAPDNNAKSGEPIDTSTGAVVDELTDFTIGSSFPFALRRSYDSQRASQGLLGWGWRDSLGEHLELSYEGEHVEFHATDGTVVPFDIPRGSDRVFNRKHARFTLIREEEGLAVHDRQDDLTRHFQLHANRGWLRRVEDSHGNGIDLNYEGLRLVQVRHSDGPELALRYVGDPATEGTITIDRVDGGVVSRLGTYTLHQGLLVDADVALTERISYSYDTRRRRVSWHDHDNKSWVRYTYDERDRCVQSRAAEGLYSVDLSYDDAALTTHVHDSRGRVTSFHFDDQGRLIRKVDPLGHATCWAYNRHGDLLAITDPLGHDEQFEHDPVSGLMFGQVDREGNGTQFFYDDELRINAVVDALDQAWTYERGPSGEIARVEAPDGGSFVYRSNACGQLSEVERSDGAARTLEYDEQGRLTAESDWAGNVHCYEYDVRDRLASVTDPGERREQLFWDPRDLLVSIEHPDRSQVVLEHDHAGLLSAVTDENGHVARREYGAFELLRSTTDAEGRRYELDYDPDHIGLSELLAPDGRRYRFEHDEAGRVVQEIDYAGRVTRYGYDAAGNRIERINAAGQVTRHGYNKNGRLIRIEADGETTEYEHDALGRLVRARNSHCEFEWEYDALGRVLRAVQNGETIEYGYDAAGRCVVRELKPGPWQEVAHKTAYVHDENGRLSLLELAGETLTFERDLRGNPTSIQAGSGYGLDQDFDDRGLLLGQQLRVEGRTETELRRSYAYDAAGNLIQSEDPHWGSTCYRLDRSDRILAAVRPDETGEAFAYDANGVLARHRMVSQDQDLDLVFESGPGGLPCRVGDTEYEFDAVGRLIRKAVTKNGFRPKTWIFAWDSRDRLTEARTSEGEIWRYGYDPLGRRVLKYNPGTRASVRYLWDGDVLLRELHLEAKGPGEMEQVARIVHWHHEPSSFRPLARESDGETQLVVCDGIGTPVGMVGEGGELVWRGHRSVWGKGSSQSRRREGDDVPIGFAGQYLDQETGLFYNRFRYYDPDLGTYIGPDPIGLAGGTQPWAYVPNPNDWTDPLGLIKALPPPRPKWTGKTINYKKGAMSPIEHVFYRHGPKSGFGNAGKFSNGTSVKDVAKMVDEAASSGNWTWSSNGRASITYDFNKGIGTHMDGSVATKLQVFLNEAGEVMTTYPF